MPTKVIGPNQNPRSETIDKKMVEVDIIAHEYDTEEPLFDQQSMRRVNHEETKLARGLEAKIRALLTDVEEASADPRYDSEDLQLILKQVHLRLGAANYSPMSAGILNNEIHSLLVRAKKMVLRKDHDLDRIARKIVRTEVIGEGYHAPLPDSYNLADSVDKKRLERDLDAQLEARRQKEAVK